MIEQMKRKNGAQCLSSIFRRSGHQCMQLESAGLRVKWLLGRTGLCGNY